MNQDVTLFAAGSTSTAIIGAHVTRRRRTVNYQQLDLKPIDPIKINISVLDVNDPFQNTSTYSQTFLMPHTTRNGDYFMSVFEINGDDFDPTISADAYIEVDGHFFIAGRINLQSIIQNKLDNTISYEVLFLGNVANFASSLGRSTLCDLDFGGTAAIGGTGTAYGYNLNHEWSYQNVRKSWDVNPLNSTGGLLNGDVLYPLVEWGYAYGGSAAEGNPDWDINRTIAFGGVESFDVESRPLYLQQLKPAPRLKCVWDAIFNVSGFTYESNFLNSVDFRNIYLLTDSINSPITRTNNLWDVLLTDTITAGTFGLTGATGGLFLSTVSKLYDTGNNVNENSFIVPITGTYTLDFLANLQVYLPLGATETWTFELFNETTNTVIDSVSYGLTGVGCYFTYSETNGYPYIYPGEPNVEIVSMSSTTSLNVGDSLRMKVSLFPTSSTALSCIYSDPPGSPIFGSTYEQIENTRNSFNSWRCTDAPTSNNIGAYMQCNITQIDLIKSICERFMLVVEPSKEEPKHFIIEPWKDWIGQGRTRDWSKKLDITQDFKIKPVFYTQKRILGLKDVEDNDYVNYAFQQNTGKTFGEISLDSGIELITDSRAEVSLFAPTPLDIIFGSGTGSTAASNPWLIAHLGKLTPGSSASAAKIEPIIPKPRIVYFNGKRDLSSNMHWYLQDTVNRDVGATGHLQTQAPQISSFSTWDLSVAGGPGGSTSLAKDLHWGQYDNTNALTQRSSDPVYDTEIYNVNTVTQNTNFNVYWKLWYDNFLNSQEGAKNSRVAEAYFNLTIDDVRDLSFNDRVWVNNAYWYVTKINDFKIGQSSLCKVELLKLYVNGISYLQSDLNPCLTLQCYSWEITANVGDVDYAYVDCTTGITLGGSLLETESVTVCSCSRPVTSVKPPFASVTQGATC
jgi:hypothetical protein